MVKAKFSGYTMAVYTGILVMATIGLGYLTLGIYVPVLIQDLNTNIVVISIMFSVIAGTSMLANMLSGSISAAIGLTRMILIGVVCLLVGYVVLYFTTSVWMVYVSAAFMGVGVSWGGFIAIGRIAPNWFIKRQSLMLGILTGVMGLGGVIGAPIVTRLITSFGWHTALLVMIAAMAVMAIPTALLVKEKPSDVGQVPLGFEEAQGSAGGAAAVAGPTFKAIAGSGVFIWLIVAMVAVAFPAAGLQGQIGNLVVSKGFDVVFAGTIIAVVNGSVVVGNILFGFLSDRVGARLAIVWIMLCCIVGCSAILVMNNQPMAFSFAILFGLSMPMSSAMVAVLTIRGVGVNAFPQAYGVVMGVLSGAGIATPLVLGLLAQSDPTYNLAGVVCAGVTAVALIAALSALSAGKKLQARLAAAGPVDEFPASAQSPGSAEI